MNPAIETNIQATRRHPDPMRGLTAIAGTKPVTLNWFPPQSASGIVGYYVYKNTELNRILNIANRTTLRAIIQGLVTSTTLGFYVSLYNALLESIKTQIVVTPL